MIVVSDTTAITTLLKAGEERLLKERFGSVIVPRAVWDELLAFHSPVAHLLHHAETAHVLGSEFGRAAPSR